MDDRTPPAGELPRFYVSDEPEHGCCWDVGIVDRERTTMDSRLCAEANRDAADFIVAALNAAADREKAGSLV